MSVLIQTSVGNIVIDLYTEVAPAESKNFLKLCKAKYYTFTPIYNIQKDYLFELGDPLYPLEKEGASAYHLSDNTKSKYIQTKKNKLHHDKKGTVSFIGQRDTDNHDNYYISSLFTVTLKDLDERRSTLQNNIVFGQVTEGLEVLDKINQAIVDEQHIPLQDIRLHHIYILQDPFDDIEDLIIPPSTPEPTKEQLSTIRLDDIEDLRIDESEHITEEEIRRKNERDADAKALTLELIGDLPSAEVKPMENVLFVCKLNSITRDDDLQIIFSRFGKIISCEVIRDSDTGDSLQYAFIEYEDKKSCENAYFKMDGVLIDDRRIHVDFSQSVSKLAEVWRNKANDKRRSGNTKFNVNIPSGSKKFSIGGFQRSKRERTDDATRDYNKRPFNSREEHLKQHNRSFNR